MFREIRNPRQIPGESPRRWFHSPEMDLIVWLNGESGGEIAAFQLCYDKTRDEKALHWKAGLGFAHMTVDDGEASAGKYKGSPLLTPDGAFDSAAVQRCFAAAAQTLPDDIRDFVETKLAQSSLGARPFHFSPPEPDQPC